MKKVFSIVMATFFAAIVSANRPGFDRECLIRCRQIDP
jgi:hypothetical protein